MPRRMRQRATESGLQFDELASSFRYSGRGLVQSADRLRKDRLPNCKITLPGAFFVRETSNALRAFIDLTCAGLHGHVHVQAACHGLCP
jgi:hypothetical protein